MDIRVYGIEVTTPPAISTSAYCDFLEKCSGSNVKGRLFVATNIGDYLSGVLVTIKDMKTICKIKASPNHFVVSSEELEKNTRMSHFNYFIINRNTGRGLYQYYHNSASLNAIGMILRKLFYNLRDGLIDRAIKDLGDNPSKKDQQDIRKTFGGEFRCIPMLRREALEELVKKMKSIKTFQYEYMSLTKAENQYTPLSAYAKRISHTVHFSQAINPFDLISALIELIGSNIFKRGVISGTDQYDDEASYKLFQDFDYFRSMDYDKVARKILIDSRELAGSIINSDMIKIMLEISQAQDVKAYLTCLAA